jgi:ComF family protein
MDLAGLRQRPAYFSYHTLWNALDWLFPPNCAGCEKLGDRWCGDCRAALIPLSSPLCPHCGKALQSGPSKQELCHACTVSPPVFTQLRSVCIYKNVARLAIHKLKYRKDIGLGESLAQSMIELLSTLHWPIDLVTCVPLSKNRMKERGYNQAAALALPTALGMGLPFVPLLLHKKRETPTQVGLSAHERRLNVEDVFEAGGQSHLDRTILLIDDVTTTGSTMNACARVLLDAGARQVFGLTFARAGLSDHNQPA